MSIPQSSATGRMGGCWAGHFARNFLLRGCGAETRFRGPQPEARFVGIRVRLRNPRRGHMWGSNEKKPEPFARPSEPAKSAVPEKPAATASKTQPPNWEAKSMANEPMYPSTTSSGAAARLGASLHLKGEITGNEDLNVDGSVEGLIQLEDRKLTVGASAKVTADIIAREVVVYGNVKGNLRAREIGR